MKTTLFFLLFVLGFAIGTVAQGAWGPRGCSVEQTATASFTGWKELNGVQYLYRDGVQIAGFSPGDGVFRQYDATRDVWSVPMTPPWKTVTAACKCGVCKCKTCRCGEQTADKPTDHFGEFKFGVDVGKLRKPKEPQYSISGRPVHRHEALAAVSLIDDSKLPFVTFISESDALANAFAGTPEAARARIHYYKPDAWELKCGFVTTGDQVYVQNPAGEVLFRKASPTLAEVQGEVRKAQPDYKPELDPNGTKPSVDPLAFVKSLPTYIWYVLGGVVVLFLLRRN